MSWTASKFKLSDDITNTDFNGAVSSAINGVLIPDDISTRHAMVGDAHNDSERREQLQMFSNAAQSIVIDPWQSGVSSDNKQSSSFFLSPNEAQELLKTNLNLTNWESCMVIMITGADVSNFADGCNLVLKSFDCQALQKVYRHAQALATHEQDKIFVTAESKNRETSIKLESLDAYSALTVAKQNLAVAESFASDKSVATLLDDFRKKRSSRLSVIKNELSKLKSSESFSHVLYLSGEYLGDQLANLALPNTSASFCCLFAIGGKEDVLRKLKEALIL